MPQSDLDTLSRDQNNSCDQNKRDQNSLDHNKKTRRFVFFALVVFAFSLLSFLGLSSQGNSVSKNMAVKQFPSFEQQSLIDPSAALTDSALVGNGYQVVNVWASWCGICKSEHPLLLELQSQGVVIVGLNYRDTRGAAQQYIAEAGNPFHAIIFDPDGRLSINLGVVGTPETYLVDNSGRIVKKFSGRLTQQVWDEHFSSYFVEQNQPIGLSKKEMGADHG